MSKVSREPIELVIEDKTYKISPPTVGDLIAFQSYMRNKQLKNYLESAKESGISEKNRNDTISKIINTPSNQDGSDLMSMEGIVYILWRCINKNHKKITLDDVGNMINLTNLNEVSEVVASLMAGEDDSAGEKEKENPTKKKS